MDCGIKLCGPVAHSVEPVLSSLLIHLFPLSLVARKDDQSVDEMIEVWGCSGSAWVEWTSSVIGLASMVSHLLFSSVVVEMLERRV